MLGPPRRTTSELTSGRLERPHCAANLRTALRPPKAAGSSRQWAKPASGTARPTATTPRRNSHREQLGTLSSF
jgi:hypothetical protein